MLDGSVPHRVGWFLMGTGTILRELRQAQDLGLREFARQVGISHSHLRKLEQGDRQFTVSMLQRLANALQVDPSALLDSDDPKEKA